ncbi:cilia- and flagella-associated protein 57 [Bemisia tabaci]
MSLPGLEPCIFYGLTNGIKNNAWFITEDEVLYPVGAVLTLHDFNSKTQKYIKIAAPQKVLSILALSPNRQYVAVGEKGDKPSISVYNLSSLQREKVLRLPFETQSQEFVCLSFTCDNRYLVAVSGDPDWMLYYYNWEKGKVESSAKAISSLLHHGSIQDMAPNPSDPSTIVLVGASLFRLLTIQESVWKQYGFQKADLLSFTSVCWISAERVMAGTKDGRLVFVENGELRATFNAMEVTTINFLPPRKEGEETTDSSSQIIASMTSKIEATSDGDRSVRCLTGYVKGFLFAGAPGLVLVFGKESNLRYVKKNVFHVEGCKIKNQSLQETHLVHRLCVSPEMDKLLCTTQRSQIFWIELSDSSSNKSNFQKSFKLMGEKIHHGPIISLSTCAWKNIFMTCGELDQTVSLWDYTTFQLLMSHTFQESVFCVSLHPTGLYAVIGFSDKLRFMLVLINQLQVYHEFPIKGAQEVAFSQNGHLFAVVDETFILIYSTITFQLLYTFKGHCDTIKSMVWTKDDGNMFSCGLDGAMYQWDTFRGKRVGDVASKSCQYSDVAVTAEGKIVYVIGNEGVISQIENSVVVSRTDLINAPLDCIVLSEKRKLLFVSSLNGVILSIRYPLLPTAEFEEHVMHNSNISCMLLTYNYDYLITASVDGCLCIWKVIMKDSYESEALVQSKEILISKDDLAEKIHYITELKSRIVEMENEHDYVTKKMETKYEEETAKLLEYYNSVIEDFKKKNHELETEHKVKLNRIQAEIVQLNEDHLQDMQNIENKYNRKLVEEYDKYQQFESKVQSMKEDFERQMEEQQMQKLKEIEKITSEFQSELQSRSLEISKLQDELKQKDINHEEIKVQIEEDADREIINVKIDYEKELEKERDNLIQLRREVGVNKKKFVTAQKEIENYKIEIGQLRQEHKQYENKIQVLEKDVEDVLKEIAERDSIIQEKEKQIAATKSKVTELEKFKYVLNYKISDLKHQILPKDQEILEKNAVIKDIKTEIEDLKKETAASKYRAETAERKLLALKTELMKEQEKNHNLYLLLDKIRIDIYSASCLLQDPKKLKEIVLKLHHNYSADDRFEKIQEKQLATLSEFNEQREYLENMIKTLTNRLKKQSEKPSTLNKMMKENNALMEDINRFQSELKQVQSKTEKYKKLLQERPFKATEPQDTLIADERKFYRCKINDQQAKIKSLEEEVEALQSRIMQTEKVNELST